DPPLRRGHGQLLPEQRGVPGGGVPEVDARPALRRGGGLRGTRRTLLARRPHAPERDLAPALPPAVRAEDRGADPDDGAARRRRHQLEVLKRPPSTSSSPRSPTATRSATPRWRCRRTCARPATRPTSSPSTRIRAWPR